jgi:hypothetical protein
MGAIADYRTAVRGLCALTPPTSLSDDQVDDAIRQALRFFSTRNPNIETYIIAGQNSYTIQMPSDFAADRIIQVLLWNSSPDLYKDLPYYSYYRDGYWYVEIRELYPSTSDEFIIVSATQHTIDGLDSAAGTTIKTEHEHLIQTAAARLLGG